MLADKAVIDLKSFAADAKKRLAAAVGDFAAQGAGLRECQHRRSAPRRSRLRQQDAAYHRQRQWQRRRRGVVAGAAVDDHMNAWMPVCARPRTSAWMSCVPS